MTNIIPEDYKHLLSDPVVVTLITLMPDGHPQGSAVWCDYDGEHILINTAVGRQKDKNMKADPRVTVVAIDPANPYRYLEVRGVIDERIDGDESMIDRLAQIYTGSSKYYGEVAPETDRVERVTYKIKPIRATKH